MSGESFVSFALLQTLFPAQLVTIEGSHKVHVVPATKDGNLLVNLVNTSGDHANPNYSGFDEIPSLRNLKVSVKLAQKPSAVILQPAGTKVDFYLCGWRGCIRYS